MSPYLTDNFKHFQGMKLELNKKPKTFNNLLYFLFADLPQ